MIDVSSEYIALQNLYSDYSACVDRGEFESWPEFFLDECEYRIQPRENYERNCLFRFYGSKAKAC
jgi:salicylate 5-hydroxylase small subunit